MILNSSKKAAIIFQGCVANDVEEFWVAALNPLLYVIGKKLLFRGTVDRCSIYPRDLIRFICEKNASSFIICHNHPSGDPQPSRNDIQITKNIYHISQLIEIPLFDHLVLGSRKYYSFADQGFFLRLEGKRKN